MKLQYSSLVYIAGLLRVADEDSLSEIAQYDSSYFVGMFPLLSGELTFVFLFEVDPSRALYSLQRMGFLVNYILTMNRFF